jgi:hypothetical protein
MNCNKKKLNKNKNVQGVTQQEMRRITTACIKKIFLNNSTLTSLQKLEL